MAQYPKVALLRSNKPFERRIPFHPEHFVIIDPTIRKLLYVEQGYSQDFGYADTYYKILGYQVEERKALISSADCSVIVKPITPDLHLMKRNSTSIGWFHCVQNQDVTSAAIHNNLTLICMESLYSETGEYLFQENSKITGKQAVIHALSTANIRINNQLKAIVIGHGNAGIYAIYKLLELGIKKIICCSRRNPTNIKNRINGIAYEQIVYCGNGTKIQTSDGRPILSLLKTADIIINAGTQNIYQPAIYLYQSDLKFLKTGTLIIDISCDKNMGFEFATITLLSNPIIRMGNILYYAIDHLPTLDYNNASKAISLQLVTLFPHLIDYLASKKHPKIIENAIQIKNGRVLNPEISYFRQHLN